MEIFGFNFKSKAEKEKEARDYMERVFPGGEKEREQVRQELTVRFSSLKISFIKVLRLEINSPFFASKLLSSPSMTL